MQLETTDLSDPWLSHHWLMNQSTILFHFNYQCATASFHFPNWRPPHNWHRSCKNLHPQNHESLIGFKCPWHTPLTVWSKIDCNYLCCTAYYYYCIIWFNNIGCIYWSKQHLRISSMYYPTILERINISDFIGRLRSDIKKLTNFASDAENPICQILIPPIDSIIRLFTV